VSDNKKVEEIMGCIRWKKLGKGTYIDLDATKAEIRKLLPPRPSVTREEIDKLAQTCMQLSPYQFDINIRRAHCLYISDWLKSKGIDVKGEK